VSEYLDSWKKKVLIVAGKCPVELTGSSLEEVEAWILSLEKRKKDDVEYKPTVYRYWARIFFSHDERRLKQVNKNIATVTGKSATIYDYMNGYTD
jgi:hypothetical protein